MDKSSEWQNFLRRNKRKKPSTHALILRSLSSLYPSSRTSSFLLLSSNVSFLDEQEFIASPLYSVGWSFSLLFFLFFICLPLSLVCFWLCVSVRWPMNVRQTFSRERERERTMNAAINESHFYLTFHSSSVSTRAVEVVRFDTYFQSID